MSEHYEVIARKKPKKKVQTIKKKKEGMIARNVKQ